MTRYLRDDNRACVVLYVHAPDEGDFLLTGDLVADKPEFGWQAILNEPTHALRRASLVKVPHHGGGSAHDPLMWGLVAESATCLVAPYSSKRLPRKSDIARICSMNVQLWQAAPSQPDYQDEFGNRRQVTPPVGAVRCRRRIGEQAWEVELSGPAFRAG